MSPLFESLFLWHLNWPWASLTRIPVVITNDLIEKCPLLLVLLVNLEFISFDMGFQRRNYMYFDEIHYAHAKTMKPVLYWDGVKVYGILHGIRVLRSTLFVLILLFLRDQCPPSLALWCDQVFESVRHQVSLVLSEMAGISVDDDLFQEIKHIIIPLSLFSESGHEHRWLHRPLNFNFFLWHFVCNSNNSNLNSNICFQM